VAFAGKPLQGEPAGGGGQADSGQLATAPGRTGEQQENENRAQSVPAVRRMLDGETVGQKASGLSAREWRELMETLGRAG